jgi:hypothetical protein
MSQNGSGPETSTAVVEDGAREVDQLDGSIASENNIIVILPQAALISRIKAHIAAGDKATGIGKSRTYELLAIAAAPRQSSRCATKPTSAKSSIANLSVPERTTPTTPKRPPRR